MSSAAKLNVPYPIAIVGGGIVGCTLALLLRDTLKVEVSLFDQEKWLIDSPNLEFSTPWRVSAVSNAIRLLWVRLGIWDELLELSVCPFSEMVVSDENSLSLLEFSAKEVERPCLGYLIRNQEALSLLQRKIQEDSKITLHTQHSLTDAVLLNDSASGNNHTKLLFAAGLGEEKQYRAGLVIGAEGKNSVLRRAFAVPMHRKKFEHVGVVCQIEFEKSHQWVAQQVYLKTGPLAFLPLSTRVGFDPASMLMQGLPWPVASKTESMASLVWSMSEAQGEAFLEQNDVEFLRQLQPWIPKQFGVVLRCSKRVAYPLSSGWASRLIGENIAWVGDSIHSVHPMAGQGLTLGLMDVANLVDSLAWAKERGLPFSHSNVLRRYERSRKLHPKGLIGLTNALHRMAGIDNWWLQMGKGIGVRCLNASGAMKRYLVDQANADKHYLPERFREELDSSDAAF